MIIIFVICYYFEIRKGGKVLYTSKTYYNTLGTKFKAKIDDCFLDVENNPGTYSLYFYYTTLNGYEARNIERKSFELNPDSTDQPLEDSIQLDHAAAAIHISFNPELSGYGKIQILRSSFDYNYLNWQEVFYVENAPLDYEFKWSDYTIESGVSYKYRVSCKGGEYTYTTADPVSLEYEDIFLSELKSQLAIRFNPNISSFKWVTQESVVNTLGGKFPIIRINGDTKYKQFTISGTLYSNESLLKSVSKDSRDVNMNEWFGEEEKSFYYSVENTKILPISNRTLFERYFRDDVMNFLTNQEPKLFRSSTEGNVLVYLSNISFTPNKTLGRNVYDFSATATEIDYCSISNLKKYGVLFSADKPILTYYILRSVGVEETSQNGFVYLTPIVHENLISEDEFLTLERAEVGGE